MEFCDKIVTKGIGGHVSCHCGNKTGDGVRI